MFGEKFFCKKIFPSVPPSGPQGPTNIPKCPHRATPRAEKVFPKIPEKRLFRYIYILEKKFCVTNFPLSSP